MVREMKSLPQDLASTNESKIATTAPGLRPVVNFILVSDTLPNSLCDLSAGCLLCNDIAFDVDVNVVVQQYFACLVSTLVARGPSPTKLGGR